MKLRLISVGKDRSGLYQPAVEEYAKRLGRYLKFELVELPEARRHAGTPQARVEEGASILAKLKPGERVVALDERGKELTSVELARAVEGWMAGGRDVALVIGGSDGLAPEVVARAQEKLALSRFTMAHRLARLVLVEQLYRALTIVRGEPYHK
ncbi:23S rRNA (pseudouridine(1915)-N(3))-methyltransferase RlmH [Anaeromyxobacter paludicola]|uniref:Ribosomal RNA large subunit methyltransferase H n=1 Tax=Anaeromyxobacter paludicola TaxID=2918171 RepID=A0ABN6N8H7_9BACT|nr:23S rRNA (pseudouridine(1915)-N(3))-methyltransferase RlmH [Anaeromyxobacter paludicola]BDG09504.1 ribosomal RNA large subunit methyltransferase H [Anaeromyxobacter paludicola]